VAPVIIACLVAPSAARQTAREVHGAAAVEPLQNEPPAKIIIDPPLAEPLSHGRVMIQYRTENRHIVPVFRPAALAVSPRVGHIDLVLGGAAEAAPFENHLHAHSKPIQKTAGIVHSKRSLDLERILQRELNQPRRTDG
jgi:uncharacterized protein DUF6130